MQPPSQSRVLENRSKDRLVDLVNSTRPQNDALKYWPKKQLLESHACLWRESKQWLAIERHGTCRSIGTFAWENISKVVFGSVAVELELFAAHIQRELEKPERQRFTVPYATALICVPFPIRNCRTIQKPPKPIPKAPPDPHTELLRQRGRDGKRKFRQMHYANPLTDAEYIQLRELEGECRWEFEHAPYPTARPTDSNGKPVSFWDGRRADMAWMRKVLQTRQVPDEWPLDSPSREYPYCKNTWNPLGGGYTLRLEKGEYDRFNHEEKRWQIFLWGKPLPIDHPRTRAVYMELTDIKVLELND